MKPSPIRPNRLKTCPLGDFDMLKSNLTSKTFLSATQTSKLRKTPSNLVLSVRRVNPPLLLKFLFKRPLKGFYKDFYRIFVEFSWIFCTSRTVHCIFCPSRTVHCISGSPKPWSKTWPKIWSKIWPKFGPKIWGDRLITGGAGYIPNLQ